MIRMRLSRMIGLLLVLSTALACESVAIDQRYRSVTLELRVFAPAGTGPARLNVWVPPHEPASRIAAALAQRIMDLEVLGPPTEVTLTPEGVASVQVDGYSARILEERLLGIDIPSLRPRPVFLAVVQIPGYVRYTVVEVRDGRQIREYELTRQAGGPTSVVTLPGTKTVTVLPGGQSDTVVVTIQPGRVPARA